MSAVLAAISLLTEAPTQNLLKWDAWAKTGSPDARVSFTRDSITLYPWTQQGRQDSAGMFQAVDVPVAGQYQLHFRGTTESATGGFMASWSVGGHSFRATARPVWGYKQRAVTVALPRGPIIVQFSTTACDCRADWISLPQPILRPVTEPTVWFDGDYDSRWRWWSMSFSANANVLLVGARRTAHPIGIPGFTYGLEIDLTSPHAVAAFVSGGSIVKWAPPQLPWNWPAPPHGDFYIQAIRLGSNPGFGSRLFVTGDIR